MRFFAGFIIAFAIIALGAAITIISGVYNVAATVPASGFEHLILHSIMLDSVRAHARNEVQKEWTEAEVIDGFCEYDAMCIVCHGAPGKERSDIGKGLEPRAPDLVKSGKDWTNAQLFWIVKNGIRMTAMPAFGRTHQDPVIWNIVGFVRRLPQISAPEYEAMEAQIRKSAGCEGHQHHMPMEAPP
ncbi:MAG: cytochrome c [Methylocapsa sp.]|nr:cytochrome c [Methylocapsa sp.]